MSSAAEAPAVPPWSLGWRLQRALAWADVSVSTMAAELGMSRTTISRWMHDTGAPPRSIYVRAWAARCRVPYEWLAFGEQLPRADSNRQPADWPTSDRKLEILAFRKTIRIGSRAVTP